MQKVIVFGRGEYLSQKYKSIKAKYEIVAFLDNNPEKKFSISIDNLNIPVYRPQDVDKLGDYPIIIMTSRNSFIDIYKEIVCLYGVDDSRILFGINILPAFDVAEKLIHQLDGEVISNNGDCHLIINNQDYLLESTEDYIKIMNSLLYQNDKYIKILAEIPINPLSRSFGRERGVPIDRYYIEKFLYDNSECISGKVGEIAERTYTEKFGEDVKESFIFHVNGWGDSVKLNLETGEGVRNDMVDCLICTQTVQMIFDINATFNNIYRLLRSGGTALITAHGIGQLSLGDYDKWGEYWRFTEKSMQKLLYKAGFKNVDVLSYGNVKTCICFLYGMCQEDLTIEDFEYNDKQYPLIIAAKVKK